MTCHIMGNNLSNISMKESISTIGVLIMEVYKLKFRDLFIQFW